MLPLLRKQLALPARRVGAVRSLHFTPLRFDKQQTSGSLFGEVTEKDETVKTDLEKTLEGSQEITGVDPETVTWENDTKLLEYLDRKPKLAVDQLLTPLQKRLYLLNVKKNGFFKNNEVIVLDGVKYKFKLPLHDIEYLEPSVYCQSYRLKGSVKKAQIILNFIKGKPVTEAITQLHFNTKHLSKEIAKVLEQGLEDAKALGMKTNDLFIQSIWTASDGSIQKRVDIKARGRMGVIKHRYINVKCVLKNSQFKKRIAYNKAVKEEKRKPKDTLKPLSFRAEHFYRW